MLYAQAGLPGPSIARRQREASGDARDAYPAAEDYPAGERGQSRDSSLLDEYGQRYPSKHGDPIEYILVSLDAFRSYARPGESSRWDAYTFAHIKPLIDKNNGEITALVHEKALAAPDSLAESLDSYVNAYYRSAKNYSGGREVEGHLDAAESVPLFLDFIYAATGRVRPFNKWLLWELEQRPLDPFWGDDLVPSLLRIVATGELAAQQALFRRAEEFARRHDLGAVIESWEPDVAFLRGSP